MNWALLLNSIGVILLALSGNMSSRRNLQSRFRIIIFIAGSLFLIIACFSFYSENQALKKTNDNQIKNIDNLTNMIIELKDSLFSRQSDIVMEIPKKVIPIQQLKSNGNLQISLPQNNSQVTEREYVKGKASDPTSKVWVIVHPIETGAYWIQPSIIVNEDGSWSTMVYFGRSGMKDVGKRFEIIAIANPKSVLHEANILERWPDAQWKSKVIEVIRK